MRRVNVVKKRRYIILYTLLLLFLTVTGCEKNTSVAAKKTAVNADLEVSMKLSSIGESAKDSQSYWGPKVHNVAKGEGGYYYFSLQMKNYLMFFDTTTKTSYPVCGKADCNHDNLNCNAFFGDPSSYDRNIKDGVSYSRETIYEYDGFLYVLSSEGNLVRVSPDGSSRQIIAKVYTYDGATTTQLVFHDDYVYVYNISGSFTQGGENTATINCFSLDGKESNTIVSYTGTNVAINSAKSFGDYLFFNIYSLEMQKTENAIQYNFTFQGLYAYSYKTGQVGKVVDAQVADFFAVEAEDALYYYVNGEGLYRYTLSDKKTERIYEATAETGIVDLSYDGNYIYMYNGAWAGVANGEKSQVERKCFILNMQGEVINDISLKNGGFCFFGDDQYLFASTVDKKRENGKEYLGYIDKSDIETAKEWTELADWPQ